MNQSKAGASPLSEAPEQASQAAKQPSQAKQPRLSLITLFAWLDEHEGADIITAMHEFKVRFGLSDEKAKDVLGKWRFQRSTEELK